MSIVSGLHASRVHKGRGLHSLLHPLGHGAQQTELHLKLQNKDVPRMCNATDRSFCCRICVPAVLALSQEEHLVPQQQQPLLPSLLTAVKAGK